MEFYANGYHFCEAGSVELVFNTETAISYLEVSKCNYYITPVLIIGNIGD
jgi:hypothetical protein